jgi:hypothetical protein
MAKDINKPIVFVDIILLKHHTVTTFSELDSDEKYVSVIGGKIKQAEIYKNGAKYLDSKALYNYLYNKRVVFWNGKFLDSYILPLISQGKNQTDIDWLHNQLTVKRVKPWKLTPAPKQTYGFFDIANLLQQGTTLEEVAGRMGLSISEPDVYLKTKKKLNEEKLLKVVLYSMNRSSNMKVVFKHPYITAGYKQHLAMIDRYLDGKEHLFSKTGAQLATEGITRNGQFKNHKDKKFDWQFNGRNVLDFIPDGWKEELKRYQSEMEAAMDKYLEIIASGGHIFEAEKVFKEVSFPSYKFTIDNKLEISSSGGGLHTKRLDTVCVRQENVHHDDVEGAYTEIILAKDIFSPEIAGIYRGYKEDKFAYKKAKKLIDQANAEGFLDLFDLKEQIKDFGIDIEESVRSISDLVTVINEGVESSKLATNEPTGNADRNGTPIYNPIGMIQGRIILQILLFNLVTRILRAGGEVWSANTDGVFWTSDKDITSVVREWEEFWGMKIGSEMIDLYIAKSDNDRILVNDGVLVEAKGDDLVHHQLSNLKKLGTKPRVVDKVILQKLLNPEEELLDLLEKEIESENVSEFAFVSKAQRETRTVFDLKLAPRINRFLLTESGERVQSYSMKTGQLGKVTNVPESPVTLYNDKLPEELPKNLNKQAYLDLIENVYSHWI